MPGNSPRQDWNRAFVDTEWGGTNLCAGLFLARASGRDVAGQASRLVVLYQRQQVRVAALWNSGL
jgi:hypothetical protein